MVDIIDYKIYGDDMQIVEIELDPGEGVRAEAGAMMYMGEGIEMQTSAQEERLSKENFRPMKLYV